MKSWIMNEAKDVLLKDFERDFVDLIQQSDSF